MMHLQQVLDELRQFSTPELCDGATDMKTMDYHIHQMVGTRRIVGTAFPIQVPRGVSGIIPDALHEVQPGQIIVIAGHGECQRSYWGDHRSICASLQKAEGVIIDGAFRDIDGCEQVDMPIFARAVTPRSARKEAEGWWNVPVRCGGVLVQPNDLIVADRNGICVFSLEDAPSIIKNARRKMSAQDKTITEMKKTGKLLTRIQFNL
ncbi:RraA family protein [Butyricicoccus sp.]|uniref:RraA family protein n=1 Tax=Butyricicoccus sp. TaxID=2049021 RepID=UPI003F148698